MSGATIYLSAADLDALQDADGIIYAFFEATDGEATSLNLARDGLRVIEKTQKATRSAGGHRLVQTALRYAEALEEEDRAPDGL